MVLLIIAAAYPLIGYSLFRLAMLAGRDVFTLELANGLEDPDELKEFRTTVIAFWPLFLFTVMVSFTIALFKKSWRDDGNFDK